jgi:hypothetical protein
LAGQVDLFFVSGLVEYLNEEFWTLDQPTRTKMLPKVQKALAGAKRFVKDTKVTLDPFARP